MVEYYRAWLGGLSAPAISLPKADQLLQSLAVRNNEATTR
ncbi:hypothetical protein J2W51_003672 [Tardiphaga robiniae]|jgi:hypothetical protein|nr:hypothetical protein [Tardiphaga robiniae]